MSRSGYTDDTDDDDNGSLAMWRGQVASAIRGKRGQAFLRELVDALDAMPEKRLIANDLRQRAPAFIPPEFDRAEVCAIGAVGVRRGIELEALDPDNPYKLADVFGIAHQLVQEIEWMNDEACTYRDTPEKRWQRVRDWAHSQLKVSP